MTKVYRDSKGTPMHIGEWDLEQETHDDGSAYIGHPLPLDWVMSDEQIVRGWDGGLYVHDDPRQFASKD